MTDAIIILNPTAGHVAVAGLDIVALTNIVFLYENYHDREDFSR